MSFININLGVFFWNLNMSGVHLELDKNIVEEKMWESFKNTVKNSKKVQKGCSETDITDLISYQGVVVENYKTNINRDHQSPPLSLRL